MKQKVYEPKVYKLDESMMFHRGWQGGPLILKIYLVNHQFTVFFLPTIAPHPPRAGAPHPHDVPLSVWYEAKGSKHVKGSPLVTKINYMMFHRGGQPPQ